MADIFRMIRSRRMRWERLVVCIEKKENAQKILVEKGEGESLLGRCRHRWSDNVQIDFNGCGLESCDSGWGLVSGSCEHFNEPAGSIKCW
jgi:hypothetical protein